ncbi:MAG: immunoglobulin domain-containing protein [Chitinivibrionales bacterium]|nr:immunoglobulin domain-containing protein [Chitinivibrionales bacterium]
MFSVFVSFFKQNVRVIKPLLNKRVLMRTNGFFQYSIVFLISVFFILSCDRPVDVAMENPNLADIALIVADSGAIPPTVNTLLPMKIILKKPYLMDSVIVDVGEKNFVKYIYPKGKDTVCEFSYAYSTCGKKEIRVSAYIRTLTAAKSAKRTVEIGMAPRILNRKIYSDGVSVVGGGFAYYITVLVDSSLTSGLHYQWFHNFQQLSDTLRERCSFSKLSLANGGDYFCIVGNRWGADTSYVVNLRPMTLLEPPQILMHPVSFTTTIGKPAVFRVITFGDSVRYQWRRNGDFIAGAVSDTYAIAATSKSDSGALFHCVVSNSAGETASDEALLSVNDSDSVPVILTQPTDQTAFEGDRTLLSLSAIGTDLTFQWFAKDTAIPSACYSAYLTPPLKLADSAIVFYCQVSNRIDTLVSDSAGVHVLNFLPPRITQQPADTSIFVGDDATFFCAATGSKLSYQWVLNDKIISTATDSILEFSALTLADSGTVVYCIVSNRIGSDTSTTALLTVKQSKPKIIMHPQNQSVTEGSPVQFSVSARGQVVSYQWQKNSVSIEQANQRVYRIDIVKKEDNQSSYRCIVSNNAGSDTSNQAILDVKATVIPPKIITHPQDLMVIKGSLATFTITASGTDLNYQWYNNGSLIIGAQEPMYQIAAAQKSDSGRVFHCVVSNTAASVISSKAVLTVISKIVAPQIIKQPESITVTEGKQATFSVNVSGTTPQFQWRENGKAIPGATNSYYLIAITTMENNGKLYSCHISNSAGSVTSKTAKLTVRKSNVPIITKEPVDVTVAEGKSAEFSVLVNGDNVRYAWYMDGKAITMAAKQAYRIDRTTSKQNGATFFCIVKNNYGADTSKTAVLTVKQ